MRRLIIFISVLFTVITGKAQAISEAFYIYRNDGQFNAFLRDEVDSIAYSYYDVDSLCYDEIVTQIVYTADSSYWIPLACIDSVSFVVPETKYTPQVVKMDSLMPYIVSVDGMKLTFSSETPTNLIPRTDDILVLENIDHEQFPTGFAGRISKRDGLQVICDSVSIDDIYEQIVSFGYYTAVNDSNSTEKSRMHLVAKRKVGGTIARSVLINGTLGSKETGIYAFVEGSLGLDLRFTFKYKKGTPPYFDISLTPELTFNIEAGAKGTISKFIESEVPLLLIPIPDTPFYFKLMGGPVLDASLKASVVAKTDAKLGYKFGVKYVNEELKWNGRNTSKWISKPDVIGNITGQFFIGLKLEPGIYSYGNIVSTTIEKTAGVELDASISENISNQDFYNYDNLRDDYLDVNVKASAAFKASAKLLKWFKLSFKHELLSGKINIFKFRLVPTFTKPNVSVERSSAIVSSIPDDKLLFPVQLGMGLWGAEDALFYAQFIEGTYSDKKSWPLNEYRTVFSDLTPNMDYTVRPLVKLFGGTIVVPQEETFKIPVSPVTLGVYDIQESSAIAFGKIDNYEALGEKFTCGIGYTTKDEVGRTLFPVTDFTGGGEFYTKLMALKPNTTYKYFAYLIIDGETYYGEEKEFTTDTEPKPVTLHVDNVTETTAEIWGKIENHELVDKTMRFGLGYKDPEKTNNVLYDVTSINSLLNSKISNPILHICILHT